MTYGPKTQKAIEDLRQLSKNYQKATIPVDAIVESIVRDSDDRNVVSVVAKINGVSGIAINVPYGAAIDVGSVLSVYRAKDNVVNPDWRFESVKRNNLAFGSAIDTSYTMTTPTNMVLTSGSYTPNSGGETAYIDVAWTGNADLEGPSFYIIAFRQNGQTVWDESTTATHITGGTTHTKRIDNLRVNTTYNVRMMAVSKAGHISDWTDVSSLLTEVDTTAPTWTVATFSATGNAPGKLIITLPISLDVDFDYYELKESTSANDVGLIKTWYPRSSPFIYEAAVGTQRYFDVRGKDKAGNYTAYSGWIGPYTIPGIAAGDMDTTAPNAPTGLLTATPTLYQDSTGIWHTRISMVVTGYSKPPDFLRFIFRLRETATTNYRYFPTAKFADTSYVVEDNIKFGTTYLVSVIAEDKTGNQSDWLAEVDAVVGSPDAPPSAGGTTPTITPFYKAVKVTFAQLNSTIITNYEIQFATDTGDSGTYRSEFTTGNITFDGTNIMWIVGNLTIGTTYYFRYRGLNAVFAGGTWSNWSTGNAPLQIQTADIAANSVTSNLILAGAVTAAKLTSGQQSWSTNIVFSYVAGNSINWSTGSITTAGGTTYNITPATSTGAMSAPTYIYLDPAISTTALQITTTYSTATGDNKILLGVAQNTTVGATFTPARGGMTIISGDNIVTGSITANKLSVTSLSAITANMGALTVDSSLTVGASGYLSCNSDKLRIDASAIKLKEGWAANNYMIWYGAFGTSKEYFQANYTDDVAYARLSWTINLDAIYDVMGGGGIPCEVGWYATETAAVTSNDGHTRVVLEASATNGDVGSLAIYNGTTYGAATLSARLSGTLKTKAGIYPGTGSATQGTRYFSDTSSNLTANGRFNVIGDMGIKSAAKLIAYAATSTVLTIHGDGAAEGATAIELAGTPTDADGVVIGDINAWHVNNAANYNRIALIRMLTQGTTATKRGGKIQFYTQPDNSTTLTLRASLTNTGTWTWDAYGAGTLTTDAEGNITAVSDEKQKIILKPFTKGLKNIKNIRPFYHKWKEESGMETEGTYVSFGARNVQKSIPEAVGMDANGNLTLMDRPLLAAALNCINELEDRVRKLEKLKEK